MSSRQSTFAGSCANMGMGKMVVGHHTALSVLCSNHQTYIQVDLLYINNKHTTKSDRNNHHDAMQATAQLIDANDDSNLNTV
jgi:hypothetical protein